MDTYQRPLTDLQSRILDFITSEIREHQRPPTRREIGDRFKGININAVQGHIKALERKGFISRKPFVSRGLTVTLQQSGQDCPQGVVRCPHCGKVVSCGTSSHAQTAEPLAAATALGDNASPAPAASSSVSARTTAP